MSDGPTAAHLPLVLDWNVLHRTIGEGPHEVLERYKYRFEERRHYGPRAIDAERVLDYIDPQVVACLLLRSSGHRRGLCDMQYVPFLRLPLRVLSGAETVRPRDSPSPPPSNIGVHAPCILRQISDLLDNGMFVDYDGPVRAQATLFGVDKDKILLRLISDGRRGNALLQRLPGFRLFSLQQLHEAIARWGHLPVVQLDFRHHFYQIGIPEELASYFCVVLHEDDPTRRRVLRPASMPMGFHSAPLCGQAVTWALLLARPGSQELLGVRPELYEQSEMPEYLDLRDPNGREIGRAFVLLDGICIFCEDADLLRRWRDRLEATCVHYNAIIKAPPLPPPADAPAGAHPILVRGTPAIVQPSTEGTKFAGVRWRGSEVQAARLPSGNMPRWTSLRAVASVVGRLLWAIRASGRSLLACEDLLQVSALVGQTAHERLGDYRGRAPEAVLALQKPILALWRQECAAQWWPLPVASAVRLPHIWAATDATPTACSAVLCDPGGSNIRVFVELFETERSQAERELQAVVSLVERWMPPDPHCLLLAIDADAVRSAVTKGYSTSPVFRAMLRRIFASGHLIHACRVPSQANVADYPSRARVDPFPVDQLLREQLDATLHLLASLSSRIA